MRQGFFTFNENASQCNDRSHQGVEVIFWPDDANGNVNEVEVIAVCRDEEIAQLLADTLNAQQVPGQTALAVAG